MNQARGRPAIQATRPGRRTFVLSPPICSPRLSPRGGRIRTGVLRLPTDTMMDFSSLVNVPRASYPQVSIAR